MAAINLAGLSLKKKTAAKPERPMLQDPTGELLPLVARSVNNKRTIEAHTLVLDQARQQLGAAAFSQACQLYAGRDAKVDDTFQIGTAEGKALVTLQNRYKVPDDQTAVREILKGNALTVLRSSYTIQVDTDAMPSFMVQAFIDQLVALARSLDQVCGTPEGQDGAVLQAITVKPNNSVAKTFHESRYAMLTPQENAALHAIMPCVVAVKLEY